MSRAYFYIDETNLLQPMAVLVVNDQKCFLSPREFDMLVQEMNWVRGCMSAMQKNYYKSLVHKYKEVQDAS